MDDLRGAPPVPGSRAARGNARFRDCGRTREKRCSQFPAGCARRRRSGTMSARGRTPSCEFDPARSPTSRRANSIGDADADEFRRAVGPHAHKLGREVRVGGGHGTKERNARRPKNRQWSFERLGRVDQHVVAEFQRGLIELPARCSTSSWREHRHFRIVNKYVRGLVRHGRSRGEHAIAFAGIRSPAAVQIERTNRALRETLRPAAIDSRPRQNGECAARSQIRRNLSTND